MLPDPPPDLPAEPRAFYAALRAARPGAVAEEVDFGDAGIGVSFESGLGAQVSRRAAVVFTQDETAHFDERTPGWAEAAAAWVATRL